MEWYYFIIFGLSALTYQVSCQATNETVKYDNYSLFRIYPKSKEQLEALEKHLDPKDQYEVLKKSRSFNDSYDVLVPPTKDESLKEFAHKEKLEYEIKETDYGRRMAEMSGLRRRSLRDNNFLFSYHSYGEIQKYLDGLSKSKPGLVRVEPLGPSSEGRMIRIVKISKNPDAGNPVILIDAGIHAREWVAPVMALYIINRLTSNGDAELNGVDWHIIPLVNPDGYEYTRRVDRMWRKTRSKSGYKNCMGVDGNRNYGFKWAVSGVSDNPCDKETYAGPKPFSEPETRLVRDAMMEVKDRLKLYVTLHSYGQYLVYPWGYTGDALPRTWRKMDKLAKSVSRAVVAAGGTPFRVLSAGQWYPAAGGSDDYAFGAVGAPYAYTMELTDGYEFVFPEELLGDVLPRLYAGFKEFGSQIRNEFSHRRCKDMRACYKDMLESLTDRDEVSCVDNASVGGSTMMVFLKALKQFCPDVIDVNMEKQTIENRILYEVVIAAKGAREKEQEGKDENRPVFMVEAGQTAGAEPVRFALYLIENLVACEENHDMIEKFRWVILPCTNPDGLAYMRFNRVLWKKNVRPLKDGLTIGVDISRNFNVAFKSCGVETSVFSQKYPGETAASENETIFVQNMIEKYKKNAKIYVSLRRDGHAIMFPRAYTDDQSNCKQSMRLAGDVAARVNQRAGGVQLFLNDSIYNMNGQARCGHSVDYAFQQGIQFAFEMRVFLGADNRIIEKFQSLPRGYENSLRQGYLSGFREMYSYFSKEHNLRI